MNEINIPELFCNEDIPELFLREKECDFFENMSVKEKKLPDTSNEEIKNRGEFKPFSSIITKETFNTMQDYKLSKHWGKTRHKYRDTLPKAKSQRKTSCEECGYKYELQCHHLTYENIGAETQKDLIMLCYKCHAKKHGVKIDCTLEKYKKNRQASFKKKEKSEFKTTDILPFGKYKNKTIEYILNKDINYMKWVIKNKIIIVDEEILQRII